MIHAGHAGFPDHIGQAELIPCLVLFKQLPPHLHRRVQPRGRLVFQQDGGFDQPLIVRKAIGAICFKLGLRPLWRGQLAKPQARLSLVYNRVGPRMRIEPQRCSRFHERDEKLRWPAQHLDIAIDIKRSGVTRQFPVADCLEIPVLRPSRAEPGTNHHIRAPPGNLQVVVVGHNDLIQPQFRLCRREDTVIIPDHACIGQ